MYKWMEHKGILSQNLDLIPNVFYMHMQMSQNQEEF